MKLRIIFYPAFLVALAGCGTVSNTDVQKMGKDTYTISSGAALTGTISGNDVMAKQASLRAANEFCHSKGKEILVLNTNLKSTAFGSTSELVFNCLDADDPAANGRPLYRKSPDVVIDNQKN